MHGLEDVGQVARAQAPRRAEAGRRRAGVPGLVEDAVQHERVEVDVQVEGAAEALHADDGPRAAVRDAVPVAGPTAQGVQHGGDEEGAQIPAQLPVERHREAQRERQREHPLAHGDARQHAIEKVRRGVRHAPAAAGRADAAPLARERDEQVVPATGAAHARETPGQDAAVEQGRQLAPHEAGRLRSADFADPCSPCSPCSTGWASAGDSGRRGRSSRISGTPGRTRTCNPQFRRLVLYPLSYGSTCAVRRTAGVPRHRAGRSADDACCGRCTQAAALGRKPRLVPAGWERLSSRALRGIVPR